MLLHWSYVQNAETLATMAAMNMNVTQIFIACKRSKYCGSLGSGSVHLVSFGNQWQPSKSAEHCGRFVWGWSVCEQKFGFLIEKPLLIFAFHVGKKLINQLPVYNFYHQTCFTAYCHAYFCRFWSQVFLCSRWIIRSQQISGLDHEL